MKFQGFIVLSLILIGGQSCRNGAASEEMTDVDVKEGQNELRSAEKSKDEIPVPETKRSFTMAFPAESKGKLTLMQTGEMEEVADLLPLGQEFEMNAEEDQIVKGSAGTLIAIPSNTLVKKDGSEVRGLISFQLTEYVRPSEFAAAGLITRNTDGDILETVGMLNLVALQGADTLQIREGEDIEVAFPLKSERPDMQVWDAEKNADGQVEWKLQTTNDIQEMEKVVPVHMKPLISDQKNQFVMLQTCSGAGWQTYFNSRFEFPAGKGEELLDDKNFLAYSFKVDRNGRVADVFVDERYYPAHVAELSRKYESDIESFLKRKYPKLNLCKLDYKKQVFRFIIKPGTTTNHRDLISLNEGEGGYTAEELSAFYEKTGNEVYLNAYLNKVGAKGSGKIPQTRAKRGRKLLNGLLSATGEVGRTVLSVASLGLINGDCIASMGVNIKYKAGVALRTVLAGSGTVVYMVFKNVRSFLMGTRERGNSFTFGDRLPKGEKVVLVAVAEHGGKKYMSRMDYSTASEDVHLNPDQPFDMKQFQSWLDKPDAE